MAWPWDHDPNQNSRVGGSTHWTTQMTHAPNLRMHSNLVNQDQSVSWLRPDICVSHPIAPPSEENPSKKHRYVLRGRTMNAFCYISWSVRNRSHVSRVRCWKSGCLDRLNMSCQESQTHLQTWAEPVPRAVRGHEDHCGCRRFPFQWGIWSLWGRRGCTLPYTSRLNCCCCGCRIVNFSSPVWVMSLQ